MAKVKSLIRKYWTLWLLTTCIILCFVISHTPVQATPAITSSVITDWTAVAEGATGESAVIDISGNYQTAVHIQAFTDMNDAHEGTEFVIQVSGMATGDEDWTHYQTLGLWLAGDCDSEPIDDDPLDATDTTIVISDTGGTFETAPMGKWIAIEDGTLINSELCWLTAYTTDTNITVQDGVTNAHAVSTLLWDTAISETIIIPIGVGYRARVICNNGYDLDGTASSLNWKVGKTVTTDMEE